MADYTWGPIRPLSDEDTSIDLGEIRPLYESWHALKDRLQRTSPESLKRFKDRLVRSLSIETGILEKLYDLDRGTTEALVLHGFVEDLVSRSSTDIEPSLLIDILRDQEAAIRLVMDCVTQKRDLTKGVLHELHAILTKHQDATHAVDQFGNRTDIPLRKGAFKEYPNNPTRPDGSVHECCHPIQVDSEIENLLAWFKDYEHEHPIIVAAWLHHRFTQIHPYQDGNGRVARALITLVLLRAELLPLVVDRDLRPEYLQALEAADVGDLAPLVQRLASLEKRAILQALSVDADAEVVRDRSITKAVIESLAAKLQKRKVAKDEQLRKVNGLARTVMGQTRKLLEASLSALSRTVSVIGEPDIHVTEGGPDKGNAHWYKFQVAESTEKSGKWVNFEEDHYFLKVTARLANVRLVFVTSFHHIGRELSGIMEATSFARLESYEGENDDSIVTAGSYFPCSLEPFVITWTTEEATIRDAYRKWLDACFAIAIKEWGDRL